MSRHYAHCVRLAILRRMTPNMTSITKNRKFCQIWPIWGQVAGLRRQKFFFVWPHHYYSPPMGNFVLIRLNIFSTPSTIQNFWENPRKRGFWKILGQKKIFFRKVKMVFGRSRCAESNESIHLQWYNSQKWSNSSKFKSGVHASSKFVPPGLNFWEILFFKRCV